MWQKFRKREEAIKVYYKDKGEPARDHLPRTAMDGVISWEPVSMHWNIILSLHLETMPCWVWLQVCQKKERSCQDVIIPPHPTPPPRIWRRCHVECGHKCVRGRNAAARTLLSHPTPLPRIWRRCHVECGRKCVRGRNAAARTLLSHPTPPHPTPRHLETMLCWLWPQLWRGCWFLSRADGDWGMAFFWLRNPLVLVAESPFFAKTLHPVESRYGKISQESFNLLSSDRSSSKKKCRTFLCL